MNLNDVPYLKVPRSTLACVLLRPDVTDADKDFLRNRISESKKDHYIFRNDERVLELLRRTGTQSFEVSK
jgi:hypothetical protein